MGIKADKKIKEEIVAGSLLYGFNNSYKCCFMPMVLHGEDKV
jgi:hypothetical protein